MMEPPAFTPNCLELKGCVRLLLEAKMEVGSKKVLAPVPHAPVVAVPIWSVQKPLKAALFT